MGTYEDRLNVAIRNIMSGNNACGTLQEAADKGDERYFSEMIKPVLVSYEEEIQAVREQRDRALAEIETKRQALEAVVSNVSPLEGVVLDALKKALPDHPLL